MKATDITAANDKEFYDVRMVNGIVANDFVLRPEDIQPYQAYLALKEWFGQPNSNNFDDSKSQWQYILRVPGAYIEIHDWKLDNFSIAVYLDGSSKPNTMMMSELFKNSKSASQTIKKWESEKEAAKKIAESFYKVLKIKAQRFRSKINSAPTKAVGSVLQNPFSLYFESANSLLELVEDLKSNDLMLKSEVKPQKPEDINEKFAQLEKLNDLYRSMFFLYIASFEGLLNLIYDLYLKKNLRDDRIYERLIKEQIDIKIRLAPIYCECFNGNLIDNESEQFKQFHTIINLRNDFIHANLTKPMRSFFVRDDKYTFLINQIADKNELPKNFGDLNYEHVLHVRDSIISMSDMILDHMKPRFRSEFRDIMYDEFIQVEFEDGEIIIVR